MARTIASFSNGLVHGTASRPYALATGGTMLIAAAHFLGSLVVLRSFGKAEFGLYSFMFTAMQFMSSISNAMICAPFSVNAQQSTHSDADDKLYFQANLALSLTGAGASFVLGWLVGSWQVSLVFSVWIFFVLIRWFLRNYCLAKNRPMEVFVSDLAYSLIFCVALMPVLLEPIALWVLGVGALVASVGGLLACGKFALAQLSATGISEMRHYWPIWQSQSRWALLGVSTAEATVNAHSWLVTVWAGPAAFAPIAAASIFFKPLGLLTSALAQVERPRLAHLLPKITRDQITTRLSHFRILLLAVWALTVIAIPVCWLLFSTKLIKPGYDANQLRVTLVLLGCISIVTSWRAPVNTLLQAAGEFRILSLASLYSGVATLVITIGVMSLFAPHFALLGVLVGQLVFAHQLQSACNVWKGKSG